MKEQIIKILESYIVDNIGETSPKIDTDAIPTIADEILALQLQQTGVSGRSEQLCGNLDENYNCKNMCLTHCIDGNKFYK